MRDCKPDWGTKSTEQQHRREKKCQLDGIPAASVFGNVLGCRQPEIGFGCSSAEGRADITVTLLSY